MTISDFLFRESDGCPFHPNVSICIQVEKLDLLHPHGLQASVVIIRSKFNPSNPSLDHRLSILVTYALEPFVMTRVTTISSVACFVYQDFSTSLFMQVTMHQALNLHGILGLHLKYKLRKVLALCLYFPHSMFS